MVKRNSASTDRSAVAKRKHYWVGFSDGKVHSELRTDGYGSYAAAMLFVSRAKARRQYQDVRKVRLVAVK